MFIAPLFTIASTWEPPRFPSTDEWIRKLWYTYTVEYYSVIKRDAFAFVLMRWMNLDPLTQNKKSHKEKDKYFILMHIYRTQIDSANDLKCRAAKETHKKKTDVWTQWGKEKVG